MSATHTWVRPPTAGKNWLAGVALYYMLTGDAKARQCAMLNHEGMQAAWIKKVTAKPHWRHSLYPSLLTVRNLLSLHAITGKDKYLADVRTIFDKHIYLCDKELGPHLFDPKHELHGQEHHRLAEQYCHGIATLCELHHRTNDKKLAALLTAAAAKPFPNTFYGAGLYLSDLYAYVGFTTNEQDAVEQGIGGFIDTFPESKKPPVYLPGKMNWSERSARVLQAGHVLQYVLWKQNAGQIK
jgi:hypothetical protein